MITTKHLKNGDPFPELPTDDGHLHLLSMRFCPYAQRIHLVLDAKSIAYHTVNINLKAKPDWLQSHSVTGKVPALRLTNEPGAPYLVESLIVADYLEEKFPTGLYAAGDPVQKANDRLRLIEFEQKVIPAYFQIAYSEANEVARQQLRTGLRVFDDELRKRATPFYGGRNAGMLDLMMWPWAERVTALAGILDDSDFCVDAESFPEFINWRNRMIELDFVRKSYLSEDVHVKYAKQRKAMLVPNYDLLLE